MTKGKITGLATPGGVEQPGETNGLGGLSGRAGPPGLADLSGAAAEEVRPVRRVGLAGLAESGAGPAGFAGFPGANPAPTFLPARKPMARATRITLFEREVRERLSRAALDIVFARAELLSEGQRNVRGGKEGYFGSTMLTIDLPSLVDALRDACDAGTAHRLVELMEGDSTLPRRIRDIAEREAARVAASKLKDLRTHVTIRAQGAKVFIDIDVEAGL
jgi:hypothetical protein